LDYELFQSCMALWIQTKMENKGRFQRGVGTVFQNKKNISTTRRHILHAAYVDIDGLKNPLPCIENMLKQMKSRTGDMRHAIALSFLTLPGKPYQHLRAEIERLALGEAESFESIIDEFKKQSLNRLSRFQPNLRGVEQDFTFEHQLLHYAYSGDDKIEIIGRIKEFEQLLEFLKDDSNFLWVQLAGAAGQGKSRLAFELICEAKSRMGFDAGYMRAKDFEDFSEHWLNWRPDRPKLIVVDYIHSLGKGIGPAMAILAHRRNQLSNKVRFLILERQRWDRGGIRKCNREVQADNSERCAAGRRGVTEFDFEASLGRSFWFEELEINKRKLAHENDFYSFLKGIKIESSKFRFGESGVVMLGAIGSDELCSIVKKVSFGMQAKKQIAYRDDVIKKSLAKFDPSGRPLFAYLLGISLADGTFNKDWERTDLLNRVLSIYRARNWMGEPGARPLEFHSANTGLHLAVAATILRKIHFEELNSWPLGDISMEVSGKEALAIVGAPQGGGLDRFGSLLPGMLPDLLGEWFVLQCLRMQPNVISPLVSWCWKVDPEATASFMLRLSQDFPKEPITSKILSLDHPLQHTLSKNAFSDQVVGIVDAFIDAGLDFPNPVVVQLEAACMKGDQRAIFQRARCHWVGIGFEKSNSKMMYWLKLAAQKGHPDALMSIGICHNLGLECPINLSEAISWYFKAAKAGHHKAMCIVSDCLIRGTEVPQDLEEGFKWLDRAIDAGEASAMSALGWYYEKGVGREADPSEAVFWYQRSANLGDGIAMFNLAACYLAGIGVNKSAEEYFAWLLRASDAGEIRSNFEIGNCFEEGLGVEKNLQEASIWFQRAVFRGDLRAIDSLHRVSEKLGVPFPISGEQLDHLF
jgi:TPR repeat protein